MPIGPAGYYAPDISDIRSEFRTRFETQSGLSPEWNQDDVLTILSEVMLSLLMENLEAVQAIWDAFSPNNATGRALENLASLALVSRLPATKSRVLASFTGTPGTVLAPGRVVENTSTGTRWTLTETVTIPNTGILEAVDDGPVVAAANTTWKIITPVNGWSALTNAADASLGRLEERDDELRVRRLEALQGANTSTALAIQTAVSRLSWVTGVKVLTNDTNSYVTVGTFTLDPHSVLVLVAPSVLTADEEDELVTTLVNTVASGIRMIGGETDTVVIDGIEYAARYDFATVVSVDVDVAVTLAPGYAVGDVEDAVEEAVADYFGTIRIGGDVRLLPIWGALDEIEGIESVSVLLDSVAADKSIADTEIAELGTVTVV